MGSPLRQPDCNSLNATWKYLKNGLDVILMTPRKGMTRSAYIGLTLAVHNYCTNIEALRRIDRQSSPMAGAQDLGAELYSSLSSYLVEHLETVLSVAQTLDGESLLIYYGSEWDRYTQAAKVFHNIFDYVNRRYVKRLKDDGDTMICSIYAMALLQWREEVYSELDQAASIPSGIIQLITDERDGRPVDQHLIRASVRSLISLGLDERDAGKECLALYHHNFLQNYIRSTKSYYEKESSEYLSSNTVIAYLDQATRRLAQEEARAIMYLHASSGLEAKEAYESALIRNHLVLLQAEFATLLKLDDHTNLAKIYQLLRRLPDGLETLRDAFQDHVQAAGRTAMVAIAPSTGDADPASFVDAIVTTHRKYLALIKSKFFSDVAFLAALDKAFITFVNDNRAASSGSIKSAELVAKYADTCLKRSAKAPNAVDPDTAVENTMIAFVYLKDKDAFQRWNSKFLARRLIYGTSVSDDGEASLISRLKEACGSDYTTSFQRMFQDISVSRDLNTDFQDHLSHVVSSYRSVDFHVLVLSTNLWPLNAPNTSLLPPMEIRRTEERFKQFYLKRFTGRKLTWLHNASRNEVRLIYTKPSYILTTSTYQAAVLSQFNHGSDSLTFDEIKAGTQLTDEILQTVLDTLTRTRILFMEDVQTYELNLKFKSQRLRLNINIQVKSEAVTETKQVLENVGEGRRLEIQAALVRIMKSRKTMKLSELTNEAISHLSKRFVPAVKEIKLQVDWLLANEYLERGVDRATLNYLA